MQRNITQTWFHIGFLWGRGGTHTSGFFCKCKYVLADLDIIILYLKKTFIQYTILYVTVFKTEPLSFISNLFLFIPWLPPLKHVFHQAGPLSRINNRYKTSQVELPTQLVMPVIHYKGCWFDFRGQIFSLGSFSWRWNLWFCCRYFFLRLCLFFFL